MAASPATFVDTNVLVYAHDRSETRKQPVARMLLEELWRDRTGVLSTQVLQEFHVVVTKKFAPADEQRGRPRAGGPLRHVADGADRPPSDPRRVEPRGAAPVVLLGRPHRRGCGPIGC